MSEIRWVQTATHDPAAHPHATPPSVKAFEPPPCIERNP